jgi:hypothetical protein
MSESELATIATFGDAQEASIVKGSLQDHDIRSFLIGELAGVTLWHVGTALGGVKLQVASTTAARATALLEELRAENSSPAWHCPHCGADVDEGFDQCWSCGAGADSGTSLVSSNGHRPVQIEATPTVNPDEIANRAWRAAVIGASFFPIWFYASFLILRISGEELSPPATRKFYGSLAIIAVAFMYFGLLSGLGG